MSLSAKREPLTRLQGCYQRAGRTHKSRILDEFCATCRYHRKAALRLAVLAEVPFVRHGWLRSGNTGSARGVVRERVRED